MKKMAKSLAEDIDSVYRAMTGIELSLEDMSGRDNVSFVEHVALVDALKLVSDAQILLETIILSEGKR